MKYFLPIVSVLALFAACSNSAEEKLMGSWQAYQVFEEGDSLAIDPAEVRFEFRSDLTYSYQSTLNYEEHGKFEVRGEYLLATDTTRSDATQKAVRLEQFSADTLVLGMDEEGRYREVRLVRGEK